ncbi:hypothetical protein DSO57_1033030 [Entomophthora muscae]|uniref:Uncharacterized protein n=1 Tax=Entomophthora muscae TaxID=34485 RepID=A0ACC2TBM8_9FUNG|nr:hypothetical protein DSO57_1033030 [Entomophthora muscae]
MNSNLCQTEDQNPDHRSNPSQSDLGTALPVDQVPELMIDKKPILGLENSKIPLIGCSDIFPGGVTNGNHSEYHQPLTTKLYPTNQPGFENNFEDKKDSIIILLSIPMNGPLTPVPFFHLNFMPVCLSNP